MAGASVETMAMIAAVKDARETRREAQKARSAARQDRIQLMQNAADKLREIADKTRASGLWRGLLTIGSAACTAGSSLANSDTAAKLWQSGGTCMQGVAAMDPYAAQGKMLEADKMDIQTRAENRQDQVERASDRLAESKRIEQSIKQQMQKAAEARHSAAMAAARGG
jgi:uncharacterized protein YlxW (UPF0749 family)